MVCGICFLNENEDKSYRFYFTSCCSQAIHGVCVLKFLKANDSKGKMSCVYCRAQLFVGPYTLNMEPRIDDHDYVMFLTDGTYQNYFKETILRELRTSINKLKWLHSFTLLAHTKL